MLASDDPFVADAVEGFRAHADQRHDAYLESLARKIQSHPRQRRRWLIPNLTVTAVAASLILIVGVWAVMNRLYKDQSKTMAAAETGHTLVIEGSGDTVILQPDAEAIKADEHPYVVAAQPATSPAAASRPASPVLKEEQKTKPAGPTDVASGTIAARDEETREPAAAVSPAMAAETKNTEMDDRVSESREDKTVAAAPLLSDAYYANQMDPLLMARRVTGRLTNPEGTPLIGANLVVRNTNLGTSSDLNGQFEIYLPVDPATVDITYSGYADTSVLLRQGEEHVSIALNEDRSMLSESVVAGKVPATRSQRQRNATRNEVTPDTDPASFNEYLRQNARYPLVENQPSPSRAVQVGFTISPKGRPQYVQIKASSGDRKLDAEAVRLLQTGPAWRCPEGMDSCAGEYTFYFR